MTITVTYMIDMLDPDGDWQPIIAETEEDDSEITDLDAYLTDAAEYIAATYIEDDADPDEDYPTTRATVTAGDMTRVAVVAWDKSTNRTEVLPQKRWPGY